MRSQTIPLMLCTLLWILVAYYYLMPQKTYFLIATAGIMMIYLYARVQLIKSAFRTIPEVANNTAQTVKESHESL
ncbi:MAG: hypothetical protein RL023_995 [Candidatus Parcubacteria bacterium]